MFAAIRHARESETIVSYDTNLRLRLWPLDRARAIIHGAVALSDIALPGLDDAQQFTGLERPEDICAFLPAGSGAQIVALTMGKSRHDGSGGRSSRVIPAKAVEAVDATGAGDTFDGAFLAEWLIGRDPFAAAAYANAAAALSTLGKGAVAPMPRAPKRKPSCGIKKAGPKARCFLSVDQRLRVAPGNRLAAARCCSRCGTTDLRERRERAVAAVLGVGLIEVQRVLVRRLLIAPVETVELAAVRRRQFIQHSGFLRVEGDPDAHGCDRSGGLDVPDGLAVAPATVPAVAPTPAPTAAPPGRPPARRRRRPQAYCGGAAEPFTVGRIHRLPAIERLARLAVIGDHPLREGADALGYATDRAP